MKQKNLLVLLSALALTACGPSGNSSSSPAGTGTGTGDSQVTDTDTGSNTDPIGSDTGSGSGGGTTQEETTYAIRVEGLPTGVKITVDKEKAKEGETVTITVTVEDGFELGYLLVNGEPVTVGADGKATFTMPNRSVSIAATVNAIGEITLRGQISAVLKEETEGSGLYVARNIPVSQTSAFSFMVGSTELDMSDLDWTKCFAAISYSNSEAGELKIEGGATYDFYYDDNADEEAGRCYIKKVKQDKLPDSPESLNNLFQGMARSESTMNPDDVLKIDYTNNVTGIDYDYQNYTNGSYAEAHDMNDGNKVVGVVDKKIKDGVLSVVNTYLDDGESYYSGNYEKYSGKYAIVDKTTDIATGYSRYSYVKSMAEHEAHFYAHNYESIYFDIMYAYYLGYDTSADIGTEGLGQFERKIVSTATADGFTVDLDSYREIDTSNSTQVDEEDRETSYYTYAIDFKFDTAGRLLSLDFDGKVYDSDAYDFSSHILIDPNDYTTTYDITIAYTYGAPAAENTHDDSAYFTSKMGVTVRDEDLGEEYAEKNAIQRKNNDSDAAVNAHMTMTSDKTTAFDLENFTIISSSDTSVIGPRSALEPFTWIPKKKGTATLTIGNPAVPSVPQTTIEVEVVDNVEVRAFYLTGKDGPWSASQELLTSSTSFSLNAGTTRTFRVIGSPDDVMVPCTPVSSNPDLLEVNVYQGVDGYYYLYASAKNASVTSETDVTITLNSDYYMADWADSPTKINVTIMPASDFNPIGTWYYISKFDANYNATAVNKDVAITLKEYDGTDATVSTVTDAEGNVYKFGFNVDPDTGVYSYTHIDGGNVAYVSVVETEDGYLGLVLEADDAQWTGQDSGTEGTIVFGNIAYDEGLIISEEYDSFAPAADWAD